LNRYARLPALLTPVVGDGATCRGVEPGADTIGAAVLGQPAGGLEEDVSGQVLGGRAVAHLGIDEAVQRGRILLKGAAKGRVRGRSTGVREIGAAMVRLPRHAWPSLPSAWSVLACYLYLLWRVTRHCWSLLVCAV